MAPDEAFDRYRAIIRSTASDLPARIALLQQANVSMYDVRSLLQLYSGQLTDLTTIANVNNGAVRTLAQSNTGQAAYDVVAEYGTLKSAIQTALNNMAANWPLSGGFCAIETIDPTPNVPTTGRLTARTFAASVMTAYVSDAQNVLNIATASPARQP